MCRMFYRISGSFVALLAFAGFVLNAGAAAHEDTYINVLEYVRAAGDSSDHTEGIRQAFNAASPRDDIIGARQLVVYFPPGTYRISDTIEIGGGRIKGMNASIVQQDPDKDIFRLKSAGHMLFVSGLTFRGGRDHLHLATPGWGGGIKWRIMDCNFYNASGWAIFIDTNMTHVLIERGEIKDCARMIYADTDSVVIKGIHGRSLLDKYGAAFELRCVMSKMEDCLWTPAWSHPDPRWIDNYSNILTLKDTRFGGEGGGFTPVVNYSKYRSLPGSGILIENSILCNMGNALRRAIVYCEEVPNRIILRNNSIYGLPGIAVRDDIDLEKYFVRGTGPLELAYIMDGNSGFIGDIPELLKNPVINEPEVAELSDSRVVEYMRGAADAVRKLRAEQEGREPAVYKIMSTGKEHTEQTDPEKYIQAPMDKYLLKGQADAEDIPNAKYFAIRAVEDDLVIMRRRFGAGNAWVLLEGFTVDADRYPILSRRMRLSSSYHIKPHYRFATVQVRDRETGKAVLIAKSPPRYGALDLREAFGPGERVLDIRIYTPTWFAVPVLPDDFEVPDDGSRISFVRSGIRGEPPLGSYMVLDYIRAEMEN